MSWIFHWTTGGSSEQPDYKQFNHDGCLVGCGPTAWGMLFGWADYQADDGNAYWSPRWGLYREDGGRGGNVQAPLTQDGGVKNMIIELHEAVDTFCSGGQGATIPWDMDEATDYLSGRTGTKLVTHYNIAGIHEGRLRDYARASIRDRDTPAVIGTGWLTHYPLAYGYAHRLRRVRKCFIWCWTEMVTDRSFYVNQGWPGTGGDEWVTASTWFAGEIYP